MNLIKNRKKMISIALSLILPVIIIISRPYGLSFQQGLVLSSVVLVVSWWATKIIDMKISSIFLISVFLIFSGAPPKVVFKFPLSSTFVLLIAATLIGEGIIKSKLSDRISNSILERYGLTGIKLVALPFIIDFILIFFIPQPFPRVILLSAIYIQFLKDKGISKEAFPVIIFSIFVASTGTSMFFLSGDILLNNLALQFAGVSLTWAQWALYMAVPTLIICVILYLSFITVFRKELKGVRLENKSKEEKGSNSKSSFTVAEKKALIVLSIVTILWMTEPIHGINAAWVSAFGVTVMFLVKLLDFKDFKKVNINLIIFLTAAFSIGGVLNHTGTAEVIYQQLLKFMPDHSSFLYFPFIILIVMILHMVIGSSITTLAVALPGIIMMNGDVVNPIVIALSVYTVANIHYLLPFHHVTIMIGAGGNHYENKHVLKFGIFLTAIVFISVLFIQIPWWKLLNLY